MRKKTFSKDVLRIDPEKEFEKIAALIKNSLRNTLKRRGLVIGLSGGIDSSVTAAIAARANRRCTGSRPPDAGEGFG